jgi:dipeptidyl aminopeptidase/acylaminoacyl peptidase
MNESEIRNRLLDLAEDAPGGSGLRSHAVRRARHRVALTIGAAVVAVVALALGSVVAVRSISASPPARPANPPSDVFTRVHGWIAYKDGPDLMAVDPAHPTNRISLGPSDRSPMAWSRDGARLLLGFGPGKFGNRYGLSVLNADGSRIRLATGEHYSASFSPDGNMVVYDEWDRRDGDPVATALYVVDSTGGTPTLLVAGRGGFRTHVSSAAWSPDGSRIAFIESTVVGHDIGGTIDRDTLSVVNADGTGRRVLRDLGREDRSPAAGAGGIVWSPDGSRLAFTTGQIFVVNADGSKLRRLTNEGYNYNPVWSPDGSTIAFTHDGPGETGNPPGDELFAMASDGTDMRFLRVIFPGGPIAWNPVG